MVTAIVIPVDGPAQVREVEAELKSIQEIVGGSIEHVTVLDDGTHMYLNEDGKGLGLPVNHPASKLMWEYAQYRIAPFPLDFIAGDVVLLGTAPAGMEGNVTQACMDLCLRAGVRFNHG